MQMGLDMDMDMFKTPGTLVLNANNDLVKYLMGAPDENADMVLEQLYDLAKLGNEPLTPDEMAKFIARSNKIMVLLTGADKAQDKENIGEK